MSRLAVSRFDWRPSLFLHPVPCSLYPVGIQGLFHFFSMLNKEGDSRRQPMLLAIALVEQMICHRFCYTALAFVVEGTCGTSEPMCLHSL
eukprot:scaffold106865_cov16-Tisochrysis_lutea.AAC.1